MYPPPIPRPPSSPLLRPHASTPPSSFFKDPTTASMASLNLVAIVSITFTTSICEASRGPGVVGYLLGGESNGSCLLASLSGGAGPGAGPGHVFPVAGGASRAQHGVDTKSSPRPLNSTCFWGFSIKIKRRHFHDFSPGFGSCRIILIYLQSFFGF